MAVFQGLRILLLLAAMSGCLPESSSPRRPVASQFFSRLEVIGARGTGPGQFNKPRSLAVDRQDNLYVADMTGRVQKFSSNGVFLSFWQMPQTDKGKPKGLGRDAEGNIVVVEPHYTRINHFAPDGQLVAQWGENGTNAGQLAFPRAVAVNSHGEIYVAEYELAERVQRFAERGRRFVNAFGQPGNGPGQFNRAEGLGLDAQDRVYVADSCNHRIQIFDRDGRFLRGYGRAGTGRGELSYPSDVQVDAHGFQYVCEFGNSRIQIFNSRDEPIEILGGIGAAAGQFHNPWSVAFDSAGNLYVADAMNHRVQKFLRKAAVKMGSTERRHRIAPRIETMNRSSRREEAHSSVRESQSLLTSAAAWITSETATALSLLPNSDTAAQITAIRGVQGVAQPPSPAV